MFSYEQFWSCCCNCALRPLPINHLRKTATICIIPFPDFKNWILASVFVWIILKSLERCFDVVPSCNFQSRFESDRASSSEGSSFASRSDSEDTLSTSWEGVTMDGSYHTNCKSLELSNHRLRALGVMQPNQSDLLIYQKWVAARGLITFNATHWSFVIMYSRFFKLFQSYRDVSHRLLIWRSTSSYTSAFLETLSVTLREDILCFIIFRFAVPVSSAQPQAICSVFRMESSRGVSPPVISLYSRKVYERFSDVAHAQFSKEFPNAHDLNTYHRFAASVFWWMSLFDCSVLLKWFRFCLSANYETFKKYKSLFSFFNYLENLYVFTLL